MPNQPNKPNRPNMPNQPGKPTKPGQPNQPTKPTRPNQPIQPTVTTTSTTSRDYRHINSKTPIDKASVLPQTGDKQQNWVSILGSISLGMVLITGGMIFKRRKRD
ncbi:hypothetical protein IV42_GL000058 [Lentilactobacillus parabuchneri]|nr:hypothetical protein IV42_GL000058 [Lentilactobacillus parabuchneri]